MALSFNHTRECIYSECVLDHLFLLHIHSYLDMVLSFYGKLNQIKEEMNMKTAAVFCVLVLKSGYLGPCFGFTPGRPEASHSIFLCPSISI